MARGSPLELNVTTQDQVRDDLQSLQWAIVDRVDAVTILEETETQVLDMLVTIDFLIQFIINFITLLIFYPVCVESKTG